MIIMTTWWYRLLLWRASGRTRGISLVLLNPSWLALDWTCSWIWLGSGWCDPNYHPDVTTGRLPGCLVRAVWLDGLAKTSEDRWRKTARAHPSELGVLASVRNLCLTGWSNCANPAGRKSPQKTVRSPERLCPFSWVIIAVLVDRWMRRPLGQHGEKVQTGKITFAVFLSSLNITNWF